MEFNTLIPELTVVDINKTKDFYISKLGFLLEYERPEDKFVFLSFENSQFMFEQLHTEGWNIGVLEYPFGRGINFSITCRNIEQFYEHIKKKQLTFFRTMKEVVYLCGENKEIQKEFLIQDPDGYLLRITS